MFHLLLPPPGSTLFPYTTLFRSDQGMGNADIVVVEPLGAETLVHLAAGGQPLIARVPGLVELRAGERVGVKLRSEEHTSELQSRVDLVCRLLLEKKKTRTSSELRSATPRLACPSPGCCHCRSAAPVC